jgi:hypothetical protein
MVNNPGHKLTVTLQTIEFNIYKNVPIKNGKAKQIIKNQLYRGLAYHLRNWIITTNSL